VRHEKPKAFRAMPNYQFIHDVEQINAFEAKYLNRQIANYGYMLLLFIRPKYNTSSNDIVIKHKHVCNNRTIINKKSLVKYIQSHNLPYGYYTDSVGNSLSKEVLVLYININPLDRNAAFVKTQSKFITSFIDSSVKPIIDFEDVYKSELNRSIIPTTDRYIDLDVDTKEPMRVNPLVQRFKHAISDIIETKHGYHIIIDRMLWTKQDGMDLYKNFIACPENKYTKTHPDKSSNVDEYITINKSNNVPIPGTFHGDFKNCAKSIQLFM